LLDGAAVQTTAASSDLSRKGGQRFTLASAWTARVHQDRLVLEAGVAELNYVSANRGEARSLELGAAGSGTSVRVALDPERASVASLVEVRNSQGMLAARSRSHSPRHGAANPCRAGEALLPHRDSAGSGGRALPHR